MAATLHAVGRTLEEFQPLKSAEEKLLAASRNGEPAVIGETRPEDSTSDNTVRAAFLRFLLLGGDKGTPLHEHAISIRGAYIDGFLDLISTKVVRGICCRNCQFAKPLWLEDAQICGRLDLSGSQIPGLIGDRIQVFGPVALMAQFKSKGSVRLAGARIGGDLSCSWASFECAKDDALSMDGANISGGVFLSDHFEARGTVSLLGTKIEGSLGCKGATFDGLGRYAITADAAKIHGSVFFNEPFQSVGEICMRGIQIEGDLSFSGAKIDSGRENGNALSLDGAIISRHLFFKVNFQAAGAVSLISAQIGGNIECEGAIFDGKNGLALVADGAIVAGSFFLRNLKRPISNANLASATVGQLVDEIASWGENLVLDGFQYGSITGGAPTDARTRLLWLNKQPKNHIGLAEKERLFFPQPWRQLQKILREMGYNEDARQVAIAFEQRLYQANLIGQTPGTWWAPRRWLYRTLARGLHWSFGILTGYGYRPIRLLSWFLFVWIGCGFFYAGMAERGLFAPSSPAVFQNARYEECNSDPPAGNWYNCPALAEEYTQFSPFAYSLDVILPVVDLHQRKDWGSLMPVPEEGFWDELFTFSWKHVTRLVIWLETLFGWAASLLLAAILSGLTKRRDD